MPELTLTATDGKTSALGTEGRVCLRGLLGELVWTVHGRGAEPRGKCARRRRIGKKLVMMGVDPEQARAAFDKAIAKDGVDWLQVTGDDPATKKRSARSTGLRFRTWAS